MACRPCIYVRNLFRWLDQGLNALLGGDPRHTVSARLGRAEQKGLRWAARICAVLSWIAREERHCLDAAEYEMVVSELWDWDGRDRLPD